MELNEFIGDIFFIGEELGLNVDKEIQRLEAYAQDMEIQQDVDWDYDRWEDDQIIESELDNEIEAMFDSLITDFNLNDNAK